MSDTIWSSGKRDTVVGVLDRAVSAWADKPFLDFGGSGFTYGEFETLADDVVGGLERLSVAPGDRVVTVLDNGIEAALCWYAVNRLGAILVPLNTALKGAFLEHQLQNTGPRVVLAQAEYIDRVLAVGGGVEELEAVVCVGAEPPAARGELPAGTRLLGYEELLGTGASGHRAEVAPTDLSAIIYTSGTTGRSKGCMLSHNCLANFALQMNDFIQRQPEDVAWTPLPLFHANGMSTMISAAQVGGAAAYAKRFSVSGFWPEIERTGAQVAYVLALMPRLLADAEDNPAMERCRGQLRVVCGAPFAPDVQEAWASRFGVRHFAASGFGLTEVPLMTHVPSTADCPPGSAGRENGAFTVRILDEEDAPVAAGTVGEIVCRPLQPNVMFDGYWRNPEATSATSRNWWWHSGDYGRMDEQGFLYFVDRKKDYVRRRGENVSTVEVEAVYAMHEAIAEVAVHAVPDDFGGDDVKVTLVLHHGAELEPVDLFEWSVERMPYYALPRYIEFREELPRNQVERITKYVLREEGVTPATWDREQSGISFERS
jgi:crotonobetaine/carnitine-CoA ligase